ncbi:uncharacterized protein LOC115921130 [Strongylocentrotus purpuratus]|uniref:Reverse transcriptase n=1 Tax=Strongylocentrotus purpuratus TaxID=7668 RepID=A0A7M7NC26_STRPU|nr:uncharacterized protein LOC115921130 [Strongylocentrotus purpuratus]
MDDIVVTCKGVTKLLKRLKPHIATWPDEISARMLKETAEQISPAITLLFQASLHQGCVPSMWKKALVVPIYKKGCKSPPGLEDKGQYDVILLDFAKAVDKVSHKRLFLKAKHCGIHGLTLQWIENFLTGRTQQVIPEGHL